MSTSNTSTGLVNHFLISTPQLNDSLFEQSIIYICEHNQAGSMGLKINHSLNIPIEHMFKQLEIPTQPSSLSDISLLDGGPVNTQQGFILHQNTRPWESNLNVEGDIHITSSKDILYEIASGNITEQYLIALGYSGWSSGQLEDELKRNAWMTLPATSEMIFNPDKTAIWQQCVDQLGFDLSQLSNTTGNA